MDSPNCSRPWTLAPLLLTCSCAFLVGFMLYDKPAPRVLSTKKRPIRLAASKQTRPVIPVESPLPIVDVPVVSTPDNSVIQHELDQTNVELNRIGTVVATAQRSAELADAEIECLRSELARFEVDLANVEKTRLATIHEQEELDRQSAVRLARSDEVIKNFENLQKQNLARQFQQIEQDRKAREQLRARLNQLSENQNEAIRERQRKRVATMQADSELAAFRQQEAARLKAEEQAVEARIKRVDERHQKMAEQRQATVAKLERAEHSLSVCQTTIGLCRSEMSRLEAQRASLLASTKIAIRH